MDTGFRLPQGTVDPTELVERIAALGYRSAWAGELWGEDALVTLARIAEHVDQLAIGTAIVNVYSRSPATLAMAAATLDQATDGPIRLGLGASTEQAISGIHGMDYDRPVRQTHEAAEIIRRIIDEEAPVTYDGQMLSVQNVPPLEGEISLFNAALGRANRRATGRVFDGWLPHNVPLNRLEEAFETIASAAREADRDPDGINVIPYIPTAVAEDEATARDHLASHLAYYVGSGEGYRRAVATEFPEAAAAIADHWADGDRAAAREAVTPAMLEALGIAGTPETARERFQGLADRPLIDEALVVPAGRPDAERVWRTVEAIAPNG